MAFQLSPGVLVTEQDLTNIVPAVSTSAGAFAGVFQWGPVDQVTTVESENRLVELFGKPNDTTATSFFTAANFLSYGNNLQVIRSINAADARNSVGFLGNVVYNAYIPTANIGTGYTSNVRNNTTIRIVDTNGISPVISALANPVFDTTNNTLVGVTVTRFGVGYPVINNIVANVVVTGTALPSGPIPNANISLNITTFASSLVVKNDNDYNSKVDTLNAGPFIAKHPGALGNSLKVSMADIATWSTWEYASSFDSAPGTSDYAATVGGFNDEVHIVVVDSLGLWSGTVGTILEKYPFLSKGMEAKRADGTNIFYKDVINTSSKYVRWGGHPLIYYNVPQDVNYASSMAGDAVGNYVNQLYTYYLGRDADVNGYLYWVNQINGGVSRRAVELTFLQFTEKQWGRSVKNTNFANLRSNVTVSLFNGDVGSTVSDGNLNSSWSIFANDELYDISLIPVGGVSATVAEYVVDNISATRKDCITFISPEISDVVNMSDSSTAVTNAVDYRNNQVNINSSYAVMDSGWKYQYDRYNDVYRWIPLNGDTAGLCARTDFTNDPWFSPAGFNRGVIKNVVKLAYSPSKTQRDSLYKAGINPVVSFPGQGTVLFGDKTLLTKPSAFDRINVRRLFIVLEKAIATAAKFQLFEFNDAFTRAQFRNIIEPFLRDVQGRRGITDFRVVCDETNNTGEVIDRNEFIADIYIQPARSINFISLNFIATRTGISFEEVGA